MGLDLAARSSRENGSWHGDVARASGALMARSPRAVRVRDDALAVGSVAAGRWQGAVEGGWGHQWGLGVAPGKEGTGVAHRGSRSLARQFGDEGAMVFRGGVGVPVGGGVPDKSM
jgi:hypothetical protein